MFVFDLNKKNIFKNFMYYESETEIPIARHSHTAVVSEKKLFVYGGRLFFEKKQVEEMFEFNFDTQRWRSIKPFGTVPKPRSHHSCVTFSNFLLIFGGKNENKIYNDLYKFNFDEEIWSSIQLESLPFLYEHTCSVFLDSMFIFGGKDLNDQPMNDLYEYNIVNYEWKKIQQKNKPTERSSHSSVVFNDQMIIFGGSSKNSLLNDLHFLNLKKFTWKCVIGIGEIPSKRKGHASVVFEDSMFVSAGFDSYKPYCNDLYEYNISMNSWKRIIKFDQILSKRFNHSLSLLNGVLCIFGGCGKDSPNEIPSISNFEKKSIIIETDMLQSFFLKKEEKKFDFNDFFDISVKVEDSMFHLHKCILSQSPYFDELFKESNSNSIELNFQIPKKMFELFIELMYGKSVLCDSLLELLEIYKYSIDLKLHNFTEFCLNQLHSRINSTNVIEILVASEKLKIELLKEYSFQIIQNSFENEKLLIILEERNSSLYLELKDRIIGSPYRKQNTSELFENQLSKHLDHLFITKEYSDITLLCSNEQEIKCHKLIIGQLEYFKVMLTGPFQESSQFELQFEFSDQVLNVILHYLYYDQLNIPQNNIFFLIELLKCSEFFMIPMIMETSEKIILNLIHPSNALEIIQYCVGSHISGSIPEKCWKVIQTMEFDVVRDLFENQIQLRKIIFQQNEEIQNLNQKVNDSDEKIEKLNEKYDWIVEKLNKM
jgi:N-acetylneuraminic acid mutarotase